MKNNIKNKLIEAANKQQINDLSDEIIRKVDTTKVMNYTPKRKRSFNFVPFVLAGASALTLAVVVGISFGLNQNNINNKNIDFTNTSSEETLRLLNKISTQESYNIINIANSLDDVLDDLDSDEEIPSGIMTPEIELALVKDFNPYVNNIESMYELTDPVISTITDNKNNIYSYKNDLKVSGPYYEYHLYYDEQITEQKNVNEVNYKEKSVMTGVIVKGFSVYDFTTEKTIKNNTVDYNSKIFISDDKYVTVDSKFSLSVNKFTYNYYNGSFTKDAYLEQKMNDEGKTTEIEFKSRDKAFDLVVTQNINMTLNCKIKSRSTKPFTVFKEEDGIHKYEFISGNVYEL